MPISKEREYALQLVWNIFGFFYIFGDTSSALAVHGGVDLTLSRSADGGLLSQSRCRA